MLFGLTLSAAGLHVPNASSLTLTVTLATALPLAIPIVTVAGAVGPGTRRIVIVLPLSVGTTASLLVLNTYWPVPPARDTLAVVVHCVSATVLGETRRAGIAS